jgi:hypothetical protein
MALIDQTMTEKNLAAHRRNAQLSHGAATPEGKERARAANLRHGYYSQLRDQALVALGEDPEGLAELVEGACQQYRPANAHQAWIANRLASLQWRIDRAERMQEGKAATHILQIEAKRREAARQRRERCADVQDFLDSLRRAAARPDFYTPAGCFERCQQVMEHNPSANMDQILDLLHQLRRPLRFSEPPPPPLPDGMSDQEWQDTLSDDEADELSVPHPEIAVAQGKERDPLREQLRNLAAEELRLATEEWQKKIAAQEEPLSTRARDVYVMEISKELELMRRDERACFREFWRLGNDLRRMQKESALSDQAADVKDRDQPSQVQAAGRENAPGKNTVENEGASGYVEENTIDLNCASVTKCPPASGPSQPEAASPRDVPTEVSAAPAPWPPVPRASGCGTAQSRF